MQAYQIEYQCGLHVGAERWYILVQHVKATQQAADETSELSHQCGNLSQSAADVFIELGILSAKDFSAWKTGQVPFLEKVVQSNLTIALNN
jgi:hypothetical protein